MEYTGYILFAKCGSSVPRKVLLKNHAVKPVIPPYAQILTQIEGYKLINSWPF